MEISVGTLTGRKGEIVKGFLDVAWRRDSTRVSIPLTMLVGESDGPVVWLQAAIHGNEKAGAAAIVEIIGEIRPEMLSGALVCIPVVNTLAYELDQRLTPADQTDMNRVMPGDSKGLYSAVVANELTTSAFSCANYILDLHAGSHRECTYHVVYRETGGDASKQALKIAESMGAPVIWSSKDEGLDQALFAIATLNGIPALVLEFGGGEMSRYIDEIKSAIRSALRAIGVLNGSPAVPTKRLYVSGWHNVHAQRGGGILRPVARPGVVVSRGTLLGEIVSLHGDVVESIISPSGPSFVRYMARSYSALTSGDRAFGLLHVDREEELA